MRRHYENLAQRWGWSPGTVQGVAANVNFLRSLAEGSAARLYLVDADADEDGVRWMSEVVWDGVDWVVVRQVEADPHGRPRRYSWRYREDELGVLAELPIDPDDDEVVEVSREEFERAWTRTAGGT